MRSIIVLCPTLRMATQKCKEFLEINKWYVCRFSKHDLMVELTGGLNIYFKGGTEGQRVLKGTYAQIVHIDEFPMEVDHGAIRGNDEINIEEVEEDENE